MNSLKFLDPVVIIGTLVSIVVSLVLFVAGIDAVESVLFGLLGVVLSLLLDLIARNARLENRVLEGISNAVRALRGVEVRAFDDGASLISYFLERARNAKLVDDVTWATSTPPTSEEAQRVYGSYYETVKELASNPDIRWREVVMFMDGPRFERMESLLSADVRGYNAVYYDSVSDATAPGRTFAIVDNEEVFLSGRSLHLAIRHPDIVEHFSQHYKILWDYGRDHGRELKVAGKVNKEAIEDLKASFGK